MTGKALSFGGSRIRPEATGFGALYFVQSMLKEKKEDIKGKTVAISGFGNVAWGAALKAGQLGAKVVTISGPDGYVYDPEGITGEKVDYMLELRASGEDIVAPYAENILKPHSIPVANHGNRRLISHFLAQPKTSLTAMMPSSLLTMAY